MPYALGTTLTIAATSIVLATPGARAADAPFLLTELTVAPTAKPGEKLIFEIAVSPRGGVATGTILSLGGTVSAELTGLGCGPRRCALGDLTARTVIQGSLTAPASETSVQLTATADATNTAPVISGTTILVARPSPSPSPSRRPEVTRTTPPPAVVRPPAPTSTPLTIPQVVSTPLTPSQQPVAQPSTARLISARATAPAAVAKVQAAWLLALATLVGTTIHRLYRRGSTAGEQVKRHRG